MKLRTSERLNDVEALTSSHWFDAKSCDIKIRALLWSIPEPIESIVPERDLLL